MVGRSDGSCATSAGSGSGPMLDCHGKVSSIDRRGKESESPDGEGSRVDAKAEIG